MADVVKGGAFAVVAADNSTATDHPEGTCVPAKGEGIVCTEQPAETEAVQGETEAAEGGNEAEAGENAAGGTQAETEGGAGENQTETEDGNGAGEGANDENGN
jgi:hypothetical protein